MDVTEYAVQRNYGFQIHVSLWAAGGRIPGGPPEEVWGWSVAPQTGSHHSFPQRPCPQSQQEALLPTLSLSGASPGITGKPI